MVFELNSSDVEKARSRIFDGDNEACFIERETILRRIAGEELTCEGGDRYLFVLERLLSELSTPVEDDDVFLGRMREGRLSGGELSSATPAGWGPGGASFGHMTLDWATLLGKGLGGVAAEARNSAARLGTAEAARFADLCGRAAKASVSFAHRYAKAAELFPKCRGAAAALRHVPELPANDFFSALQSIWFVHFVTSCVVGARDFAFGRMDQYLFPYYARDLAEGVLTRRQAVGLIAQFLMKTNEITGTATWNHRPKPIPSQASKQYLVLGGRSPEGLEQFNDLSLAILEAAEMVGMPEPVITIRMDSGSTPAVKEAAARAAVRLGPQAHFFNDAVVVPELIRRGVARKDACGYAMVGCCRADIPSKMDSGLMLAYHYHNCPEWLLAALEECPRNFEELFNAFANVSARRLRASVEEALAQQSTQPVDQFHIESLLLEGCVERCLDCHAGGASYIPQGHFLGGIATVADSIAAVKRVVFDERRMPLAEFMRIVKSDFDGNEELRAELRNRMPKFGNGNSETDGIARRAGEIMLDVLDGIRLPPRHILFSGFYSLDSHHRWGHELPSTPDGRIRGEPVSENLSPAYGADRSGVTALLRSVASLPLSRTVMGGLNVKFGGAVPAARIADLLDAYFRMGGLHVGFTFTDRRTLEDAMENPWKHRSLCVRMYGFSEYFTSLSIKEQEELARRTECRLP